MGVRILHDDSAAQATLYCSTSEWAFGPVFHGNRDHSALDRAEAFLRWLRVDAREFDQHRLEMKYLEWFGQEDEQWKREYEVQNA